MPNRFHKTGLNESTYERPQQTWVCGWAASGRPCRIGPSNRGNCVASFECTPSRKGDRWQCTRLPVYGGRCADGPHPDGSCCKAITKCQPVRSLRSKRARLTGLTFLLTLGVVIIAFSSLGPKVLSPGPLHAKHSTTAQSCSNCHTTSEDNFSSLLAHLFSNQDHQHDSLKCIECHNQGDAPLFAHSQSEETLAIWTKQAIARNTDSSTPVSLLLSTKLFGENNERMGELPCATCHIEHRGRNVDLKHLTSTQCQSCHIRKFTAFDIDHPDFHEFPEKRRTRIVFDHLTHKNKHFLKKSKTTFDCVSCHIPHENGTSMLTRNFQNTCAECHKRQIVADAHPVLVIPALDLDSLEEREVEIGDWPEEGIEGLSPFLRLMLIAQPQLNESLTLVDEIEDLEDLSDEDEVSEEHLEALTRVTWGIKQVLHDLVTGGHEGLRTYLSTILEQELPDEALTRLSSGLNYNALREMVDTWFPDIQDELEDYQASLSGSDKVIKDSYFPAFLDCIPSPFIKVGGRKNDPCDKLVYAGITWDKLLGEFDTDPSIDILKDDIDEADPSDDWSSSGGWYFSEDEGGLYYKISGHADSFSQAWLEISARSRPLDEKNFAQLSDLDSPGRCTKCHSIEELDSDTLRVNWRPFQSSDYRKITIFSHQAHLNLGDKKDCLTCHALDDASDYLGSYSDHDPHTYESNFTRISMDTCQNCHNKQQVGNNCLTCHRYHVGENEPTIVTSQTLQ